MSTMQLEWDRLFRASSSGHPSPTNDAAGLMDQSGRVRALVLELARPADWEAMSSVWRGVQTDLGLPAPAIAVSGVDAYQLWFSLADPVPVAQGHNFLESLRERYLRGVAPERIGMLPSMDLSGAVAVLYADRVPALQSASGRWSAFVAPDLASIFSDEPWLDRPPSEDAQASVLSRLQCIQPDVFQALIGQIRPAISIEAANTDATQAPKVAPGKNLDARQFLQGVLNDESLALHLRIEAAKALLH